MTKLEEYTAKAAESLAAVGTATTERDRAFHNRAHAVWRRLIASVGENEERAATGPERASRSKPIAAVSTGR